MSLPIISPPIRRNSLERLVELARTLCDAGTVGISVEQNNDKGERIFLWVAMAGELKHMLGGTTPRNFSPCGICVDQKAPLLMDRLDRFYPYFREAPLPFVEALLIPWEVKDGANGTCGPSLITIRESLTVEMSGCWDAGVLCLRRNPLATDTGSIRTRRGCRVSAQ